MIKITNISKQTVTLLVNALPYDILEHRHNKNNNVLSIALSKEDEFHFTLTYSSRVSIKELDYSILRIVRRGLRAWIIKNGGYNSSLIDSIIEDEIGCLVSKIP